MPKHEFGIMVKEPSAEERFDSYEPQKYNCITVDNCFIETILIDLLDVACYWHTLKRDGKGLAYAGITLIPPQSMDTLIKVLSSQNNTEYSSLIRMANKAKDHSKYIIHFGI